MTVLTKQFPRAFCDIQRHWAIYWEQLEFIFVEVVDYLANKSVFKDFFGKNVIYAYNHVKISRVINSS